jgi:hypothetical protein
VDNHSVVIAYTIMRKAEDAIKAAIKEDKENQKRQMTFD